MFLGNFVRLPGVISRRKPSYTWQAFRRRAETNRVRDLIQMLWNARIMVYPFLNQPPQRTRAKLTGPK